MDTFPGISINYVCDKPPGTYMQTLQLNANDNQMADLIFNVEVIQPGALELSVSELDKLHIISSDPGACPDPYPAVTFTNTGGTPIDIELQIFAGAWLTLADLGDTEFTLQPGESRQVVFIFTCTGFSPGENNGIITVIVDNGFEETSVDIPVSVDVQDS